MANAKSKDKNPTVVGASVPRNDVLEKVTGSATYLDDIQFGNKLLYARAVRSPHPHALIKSIDTSKAEKIPRCQSRRHRKGLPGADWALPQGQDHFCYRPCSFPG